MWGVILALQSSSAVHLGVDILDVHLRCLDTVRITKVLGHADEGMVHDGRVRELDTLGNNAADEAADLVVGGLVMLLLMRVVICLGSVGVGIFDVHRFFIAISRAVVNHDGRMVLLQIPWYCLLVPSPKGARWFIQFGIGHSCPGHLVIGTRIGSMCLLLLFVLLTLLIGPTLLVFWSSGFLFLVVCTGLPVVWILELVAFLIWSCSFCMSFGMVRGCPWRRLFLVNFDQGVQFKCRLSRH